MFPQHRETGLNNMERRLEKGRKAGLFLLPVISRCVFERTFGSEGWGVRIPPGAPIPRIGFPEYFRKLSKVEVAVFLTVLAKFSPRVPEREKRSGETQNVTPKFLR